MDRVELLRKAASWIEYVDKNFGNDLKKALFSDDPENTDYFYSKIQGGELSPKLKNVIDAHKNSLINKRKSLWNRFREFLTNMNPTQIGY